MKIIFTSSLITDGSLVLSGVTDESGDIIVSTAYQGNFIACLTLCHEICHLFIDHAKLPRQFHIIWDVISILMWPESRSYRARLEDIRRHIQLENGTLDLTLQFDARNEGEG